jgi:hypothetical protein
MSDSLELTTIILEVMNITHMIDTTVMGKALVSSQIPKIDRKRKKINAHLNIST